MRPADTVPLIRVASFAVLVLLALTREVRAQGTQGQLPDPISAARLSAYAEMLGLSPQQRHALNDLHAPYREEFQTLREGEIEAWLKSSGVAYTRKYITTKRQLIERIAAIDNRLFDSTMAMLTEDQVARLPRLKALRQRERAMAIDAAWAGFDAQPFDISQAIGEMALLADQLQAIDSTLQTYEATLTPKFERAVDAYFTTSAKSFDAYDKAGWTEERRVDPANFEAQYAVVKPIWNEHAVKRRAAMKDVVALNRRTVEALQSLLPAERWLDLHKTFIASTYSNGRFLWAFPQLVRMKSPYEKALARENLTEEHRETLKTQAAEFDTLVDAAVKEIIEKVEKYRDTYIGDHDRKAEFEARTALDRDVSLAMDALWKQREKDEARIVALIGPAPIVEPVIHDPESADFSKVGVYSVVFDRSEIAVGCPSRISTSDVLAYARWLKLDEARFAILRGIHEQYLQRFEAFKAEQQPRMRSASEPLYAGDSIEGYTRENLQRSRAASDAADRGQREMEQQFFAEVAAALSLSDDDVGFQRVRLSRERQWLNNRGYDSRIMPSPSNQVGIFDLEWVLRRVRNLDLSEPAVDAIMWQYEQAVATMLKVKHEAVVRYSQLSDDLRVEWQELRVKSGEKFPDMRARHAEAGEPELRQAAKRACEPIAELNRATVDRLVATLPPDQAQRVRRIFDRLSWPRIYEDGSNVAPVLAAAMKRDDLTPQQRSEIENLAAEYHPAYDAMIEKMKASVEKPDSPIYEDDQSKRTNEEMLAFWARNGERKRMLFDRHELNVRAWQRLKGILTEDQAMAIGMGATPPEGPGEHDDFGS